MTLLTLVLFADYARKFESAHLKKVGDLKPRDVIEEEDTVGQMHRGHTLDMATWSQTPGYRKDSTYIARATSAAGTLRAVILT